MADEKPLTKSDLVAVLKEIGVATNDTVHNQLTELFDGLIRPEFESIHTRLTSLETDVSYIKTEIDGIKAELSDTPSRREFNQLEHRVDRLEQAN